MPKNTDNFNDNLIDFLRGKKLSRIKTLDIAGKSVPNTRDADQIQFNYINNNQDYGTVTIAISPEKKVTVLYSDSVTEKGSNFSELYKDLKNFLLGNGVLKDNIKKDNINNLSYVLKDIHRLKNMKKEENLLEGWWGNRNTSYSDSTPASIKMIVKHSRPIEEGEQRYRYVEKIFLETERGERLLLNTKKPSVGRVFARHLAEGGEYNDDRWRHLNEIAEDINRLGGFVRATRDGQFNESAHLLVQEAHDHYYKLRETIRKLGGSRGYNQYFENWKPVINEENSDIDYSSMFRHSKLDPRIESALPVLKKLNIKVQEIKEVNEFESWANNIVEDHSPIEHNDIDELVDLLNDKNLTVGPNAENISSRLETLIHDEKDKEDLFSELKELASISPDKDPREVIKSWLERNSNDDFYNEVLEKLDDTEESPDSSEEPPEESPAPDMNQQPPVPPQTPPGPPAGQMPPAGAGMPPTASQPTLENQEVFEKKNSKSSSPRNFVAKHAQRSGAGSHTKKGFQRHSKHKKKLGETSIPENKLEFKTIDLESSDIEKYTKMYFDRYDIDKPHGKFITNIKSFSRMTESKENKEIEQFIQHLKKIDSKKNIKVGDKFSVLEFEIIFAWKEINGRGFTSPKEVSDVKRHQDGTINYIKFTDGDRYPRLTPARYEGKPISYASYFDRKNEAEKALTSLILIVPDDWDLDVSDIKRDMNESLIDVKVDSPRIREYKDRNDKSWWEVLDTNGHRVSGQGSSGFDSLENAKELYKSIWNSKPVIEKLKEDVEEDIGILNRIKKLSGL